MALMPPGDGASLAEWLSWLEQAHPSAIDLGLDRITRVAVRAGLAQAPMVLITVAGTNGKGSTVAMLAEVYRRAGYRTGRYMSPHIERFNERIEIDGQPIGDEALVQALTSIAPALGTDSLSYFEYTTLAAMRCFIQADCEVVILEVGLGGRLDATNLWDADCAIVTSIALDHADWLGHDLEQIGIEKASIGRTGRPLLLTDPAAPQSIDRLAEREGMQLQRLPPLGSEWTLALKGPVQRRNAAAVVAAIAALQNRLPVSEQTVREALAHTTLVGRLERRSVDGVEVILDVAHNPAAAEALADALPEMHHSAMPALFAVMADKDLEGIVSALSACVSHWYCTPLELERALPASSAAERIEAVAGADTAHSCSAIAEAWTLAAEQARARDCPVLVMGSFFTLAALHEHWQARHTEG